MKVLFTGGSSFTGFWFIRELAAAGHHVTAIFRKRPDEYSEAAAAPEGGSRFGGSRPIYDCSFGDARFLGLIAEEGWDFLCHHGADVTNYKSPDFDPLRPSKTTPIICRHVLEALGEAGCRRVLLTGSVFEAVKGAAPRDCPTFLRTDCPRPSQPGCFGYYCRRAGIGLGKFVIPNPFGPFEEPRFTGLSHEELVSRCQPSCSSPPTSATNVMCRCWRRFTARFAAEFPASGFTRINPSGYAESQGAFTLRLAQEMRPRLGLPCPVELKKQVDFPEPRVRINTDLPDVDDLGWDESAAWDEMARYYQYLTHA